MVSSPVLQVFCWLLLASVQHVRGDAPANWRCTRAKGKCGNTSCCPGGDYKSGLCDGAANRKCCLSPLNCADSKCHALKGSCGDVSCCPNSNYRSGRCSGGANRKCCLSKLNCATKTVSGDSKCTSKGGKCGDTSCCPYAEYSSGLCSGAANRKCCFSGLHCNSGDSKCYLAGGKCGETSCCPGANYKSGLCSGAASRKCCLSEINCATPSRTSCTVRKWTGSNFVGDVAYVDDSFRYAMDIMNKAAGDCGVKIYVTHSWRKVGAKLGNTVVPPSSSSNHLVGRAIDMNVDTPSGRCISTCLKGKKNSDATCFIDAIKAKGLTWGGDWNTSDPVHIDDRRNKKAGYSALKDKLQAACKDIPMS